MVKIPIYSKWRENKRQSVLIKRENQRKNNQKLKDESRSLETKIANYKDDMEDLKQEMQQLERTGAIHSTDLTSKRGRLDKIRAQRLEIEIRDGERSTYAKAKVVDGFYIEFRYKGKKQRKIIATNPVTFEYEFIPYLLWRRGLKYYTKAHEETTCLAFSNVPKIIQAKVVMKMVRAVAEAETWIEIAKATKGTDRKQLMMWLIAITIISVVGLLVAGDYFK